MKDEDLFPPDSKLTTTDYTLKYIAQQFDEFKYNLQNDLREVIRELENIPGDKSLTHVAHHIIAKAVKGNNYNRVYEKWNAPVDVVCLFLKGIISFKGLVKELTETHSFSNLEIIKLIDVLNEYLPEERQIKQQGVLS